MTRISVQLTPTEQQIVASERYSHPKLHVRRKMLVLWAVHIGLACAQAGQVARVGRATVQRYLAAYRDSRLDGLRRWNVVGPVSDLVEHRETIKASVTEKPVRTIADAADRIKQLTSLKHGLTQTRVFLQRRGFRWQRRRAVPVPPKSLSPSMWPANGSF